MVQFRTGQPASQAISRVLDLEGKSALQWLVTGSDANLELRCATLRKLWTYMYTHTHIYAYIYTCMHTYTHVHTHTCKSIRTRKDVHACSIHTYKQLKSTRTQTRIHVCTHTYTHIYIYTYIHTYLHKHIHPYMHARIHADKCVCVRQRWMAPFLTTWSCNDLWAC